MGSILDQIVTTKRQQIQAARAASDESQLRARAESAGLPRPFLPPLDDPAPIRLIAEVKKASPSAGIIRADFDPAEIARSYQDHGAAAISVLTDEAYFQGSLDDLQTVRGSAQVPVLRKDFILDSYQLYEARAAGADAILLIAECLDDTELQLLFNETTRLGMTPLVEFYDAVHLTRVLDVGATLIGVNNRDLRTFKVDLDHSLRMRERIPDHCRLVAESGIRTREDARRLEAAGVQAMLVGEALMRQPDIGAAVDQLLGR